MRKEIVMKPSVQNVALAARLRYAGFAVVLSFVTVSFCEAAETGDADLQDQLNQRVSIDLRAPIEDVVRMVAEQAGASVVISPEVKGDVTVKLTRVTLAEALQSILDVHGFTYVAGNSIIRVVTRDQMPQVKAATEKEVTRVFEITYADAGEVTKSLDKLRSDTGSISFAQGTSHIVVTDRESRVQGMADFVTQVDKMTPQILVEARIYDITTKDRLDLGVQWDFGTATTYDPATLKAAGGDTQPFGGGNFNGNAPKSQLTKAGLRFGWLNDNVDLDFQFKAQAERIDAKLLANPRVLVLDNEKASIRIVSEIPYQQLQESQLGGRIGATAFREVGVELEVTPHLAARDGLIRMHLKPKFSVVTGEVQVAGIGVTYPQPVVDKREADTKLLVRSGQTVVLGGLRKTLTSKQVNKIPLLGDIPLAGALFRYSGDEVTYSELLVFITPKIVEQPVMDKKEIETYHKTDTENCQPGSRPVEVGTDD
jgi:type IV pilus secretin PilQ/predicted competence protein